MQLELKHLAPYLPYGLKSYTLYDGHILIRDITVNNVMAFVDGDVNSKPIMRQLSDLTKEIEYNGKKLIMFDRIEIYKYSGVDYLIEQIRLGFVEVIIYNMLIEYHFDVFGLIEQGLAIDINTLNK